MWLNVVTGKQVINDRESVAFCLKFLVKKT